MVIGVFKPGLQGVVIDVADGEFGFHLGDADGFELEIGHRSGSVLGQGLVNPDADFPAFDQVADDQVFG